MGCLGNILWFLFGGLWTGLSWVAAGVLWCITIRWYPHWEAVLQVCEACIFSIWQEVEYGGSAVSVVCNIFWLIFSGIPMAVEAAVLGAVLCVTIIGIPFGKQCFKLAKLALMPFGATVR